MKSLRLGDPSREIHFKKLELQHILCEYSISEVTFNIVLHNYVTDFVYSVYMAYGL